MKKKSFKGGIDGLLGIQDSHSESFERKKSKPRQEPYVTGTFRIRKSTEDYIRRICYWDPKANITIVVNKALQDHVSEYIKKNGELKPIPEGVEYTV